MCAEASTVLRAVAADFFFNCWYLEIPSDNLAHLRQLGATEVNGKLIVKSKQWIQSLFLESLNVKIREYVIATDCL
jgi:hypothetical protein